MKNGDLPAMPIEFHPYVAIIELSTRRGTQLDCEPKALRQVRAI
jgi:hypothetical protein